ncbi:MAG TPA: hypothetical protein VFA50_13370 [Stellaceae bacterium]|nr:hypothetical protein [Stellaceae bacterium]
MTDTEAKPFEGYGFASRTFWIKGKDLVVARCWEREWLIEPSAGSRFSTSITGKAVSEKDSVRVIGKDRETKEFDLTIRSDETTKQEWEWHKANDIYENDGTTPELRVSGRISEALGKTPPTATLFVTDDDWEIGSKGGWSIECAVPPPVLAQLEAEVLARRASDVYIGIEWTAGLVRDEHAPPSLPTSWGLFTINERHGPEPLRGHIKLIGWRVSDRSVTPDEPMPIDEEPRQASQRSGVEEEVHRLGQILAGQMLGLTRACTFGFFAVLALILIGHFFR